MHPLAHAGRAVAIECVLPPAAGSNAQRVAVLHKENIAHIALVDIAETGIGSGDVVHHGAQHHAVVGKAVAPSQSAIGPVNNKHQLVVALANPVLNLACADAGIHRSGLADRRDSLRIDTSVHPVVPVGVVGAIYHHTCGRVSPTAEIAGVQLLAQSARHAAIEHVLPPAACSLAQGVAVLDKEDVVDAEAAVHKGDAAVGFGNVVHHVLQIGAAGAEAIAPSQSGIGPVDSKDNLKGAFTYPVGDVLGGNGGINRSVVWSGHRSRSLLPGIFHEISAHRVPARTDAQVAILEHIAVVQHSGGTAAGADTVFIRPPEVIAHRRGRAIDEAQRITIRENKVDIAVEGRRTHRPETGVGGGNAIYHSLRRHRAVEAVTPGKGRIGVAPVDNQYSTVAAVANPIEDVVCVNCGIHRVGIVGIGGCRRRSQREITAAANLHHVAVGHILIGVGRSHRIIDIVAPIAESRTRHQRTVVVPHTINKATVNRVAETGVVGHDGIEHILRRSGAVPAHTPGQRKVRAARIVVPTDYNHSLIAACTCPELDVRCRESDGFGSAFHSMAIHLVVARLGPQACRKQQTQSKCSNLFNHHITILLFSTK